MKVTTIRTPGLGDSTYVLSHGGIGVVVDPQRDVERFRTIAEAEQVEIRYVLETHLHNDYVSGGRHLAKLSGADLVVPAGAGVAFQHTPAFHLEDMGDDAFNIRPIHTPGHTPEHTSYLVLIDGEPSALFSGGSLLVGSAGRPDLLGWDRADSLARLQYGSVRRLASLPDQVELYPTHGEGSFCTASGAGRTTSTIGAEKADNPVLAYPDEDSFVEGQLGALQPYPTYYAHMGPINLMGPSPLPSRTIPELTPEDAELLSATVTVVDARPRSRFAAGHIPGSLGVELRDDFGTWVGWLVPFGSPIVLVLDGDQNLEEAVVQLARIGYEDVRGVLRSLDAWRASGQAMASFRTVTIDQFVEAAQYGAQVLDVRSPGEFEAATLEGSIHRYVPDLLHGLPAALDRTEPIWVGCGTGYRAAFAASLIQQHGGDPVVLIDGGIPDVLVAQRRSATDTAV